MKRLHSVEATKVGALPYNNVHASDHVAYLRQEQQSSLDTRGENTKAAAIFTLDDENLKYHVIAIGHFRDCKKVQKLLSP